VESLLSQAREGLRFRERLGLVGAAVSDHPQIEEFVARLRQMNAKFSVSSERVRPLSRVVLRGLTQSGTKTVSLAPESGSERLRQLINKGVSDDDVLRAVEKVAEAGLKQLKLYFMLGLPTESEEDIEALIRLALACKGVIDSQKAGVHLILNIVPFVPKAGTPFQWLPMCEGDVMEQRLWLIKRALQQRGIEVREESIDRSQIQGILSKGDSRLGAILATVGHNSFVPWLCALEDAGLSIDSYIHREIPSSEKLPWSTVDSGVTPEYLQQELGKARLCAKTPPCLVGNCHRCGVC
jgi:hypothetical protein